MPQFLKKVKLHPIYLCWEAYFTPRFESLTEPLSYLEFRNGMMPPIKQNLLKKTPVPTYGVNLDQFDILDLQNWFKSFFDSNAYFLLQF